jgi:hypothetical protein
MEEYPYRTQSNSAPQSAKANALRLAAPFQRYSPDDRNGERATFHSVQYRINIEVNHAHTFWGLCTRLYTKLAAHTLCIYSNRLLGKPAFLQIKALAFPI